MRVVIARMQHETNTFSPVPTPLAAFGTGNGVGPYHGREAGAAMRGARVAMGAFLDLAEQRGCEIVTPIAAMAYPSAPVEAAAYARLCDTLCAATADALPRAFDEAVKGRAEALFFPSGGFTSGLRVQIAALALQHRLPSMLPLPVGADAGGLMAYGPNDREFFRQAAVFVDKILKGTKPGDLPVEQPTRWELVINLKTAKALGISVPQTLLLQAERVIE